MGVVGTSAEEAVRPGEEGVRPARGGDHPTILGKEVERITWNWLPKGPRSVGRTLGREERWMRPGPGWGLIPQAVSSGSPAGV